jgi:hypothetical protein
MVMPLSEDEIARIVADLHVLTAHCEDAGIAIDDYMKWIEKRERARPRPVSITVEVSKADGERNAKEYAWALRLAAESREGGAPKI